MGLPWFRVNVDMADHPRTLALCDLLKDPKAGWYVIRLWSWTMRYAPSGRLPGGARVAVERACEWSGKAGQLVSALLETGWLESDGAGALSVHDWDDYQGAAVEKAQKDSERKKTARRRRGDGAETARAVSADGAETARVRDVTIRDETGREALATDKPSPRAKSRKPVETDALCEDFMEVTGSKYAWQGAKDGTAFHRLRKDFSMEEIRERWQRGLRATGWLSTKTIAQLAAKWNDLAPTEELPKFAVSEEFDTL